MSGSFSPEKLKKDAEKAEKYTRRWMGLVNKKKSGLIDNEAHEAHRGFFKHFNCLDCANCCKTISPTLYDKDIERLAKALHIRTSEFIEKYIEIDEDRDYVFRQTPCPFLDLENYCMVYENRPKACREYPHTDRPRFYQIFDLTLKNTYICPAAYEVMDTLKKKIIR